MSHWARQNLVGAWCPAVSGSDGYLLRDLSGNGNHGTLTNMDPATDWVTSNGYQALDFDGVNDSVLAATSYVPSGTNWEASLVLWSEQTGVNIGAGGSQRNLLAWGGSTFNAIIASTNTSAPFNGAFTCGTAYSALVSMVDKPAVGRLACFVMSIRNATIHGYVDGVLQGVDSGVLSAFTSGSVVIGAATSGSQFNASRVFDCRIYSRALSESEAKFIYAGGPGYGLRPDRRRKYYFVSGGPAFKPYWVRRQSQVIGGGVS